MLKNKTNIIIIILLASILCLLLVILAFMIVRDFLPTGTNILPITIPTAKPIPTFTIVPTIAPTLGPQWVWSTLPLYNLNVEMPSDWHYAFSNRHPEPTDPSEMGASPLGHDCTDYQLISPDRLRFINITMPCGFGEGFSSKCSDDTTFIQAVENDSYLVRWPSGRGFIYEISSYGMYDDMSGLHTGFICNFEQPKGPTAPIYFYWEIGKENYWETRPNAEIDRIMLSLLTSNK